MKSSRSPSGAPMSGRIGLLAGSGRFPFLFARAAQKRGMSVVCVGIEGNAQPTLAREVDTFFWNKVARLGSMIGRFKRANVDCVVMAGKIHKSAIFDRYRLLRHLPDWRFLRVFFSKGRTDNRDDALLLALVREFEKDGIQVASALDVCPEILAGAGCLTDTRPTDAQLGDIAFGWQIAKSMGRFDIGQCIALRDRAVLAVEAIEGTDDMISRAGSLCRSGGFTVIKVAKPQQDMRFDVPTIGEHTIESMIAAGATCLAIESGRTIIIDEEDTVKLADRHGISVVALNDREAIWGGMSEGNASSSILERRLERRPA